MIDFDKFITKREDEMLFDKYKRGFPKFDDNIIMMMVDLQKTKNKEIVITTPLFTMEKKDIVIHFS